MGMTVIPLPFHVDLTKLQYLEVFGGGSSMFGLTQLVSLNLSTSQVTSEGLPHLKPLKKLKSLRLESIKVTANDIKQLQEFDFQMW
ncbi:unnamed protein product [Lactuca virosa]|uniref:Uncharacterized protein n=1 Tax=Lactuca virosa TaxID=75947 RepID=A0AAU9MJN8_9ASTR|nr:unnamed protein product [Lactuca virosa]